MHRKTRPLNFTIPRLYTSTYPTCAYVCVCVDFPEALFAAIAAATSAIAVASRRRRRRQRGLAMAAAAREAAVKNIVSLAVEYRRDHYIKTIEIKQAMD
ncbi:Uncharacterized protein DBV15_05894 [Temnothorax longispinosus]|uniref:Uncharacterized protein n=1 Tax=Temnothorax longispinosus TaxID=300112 RepID=A0A4S2KI20_9HYME|nr:Uncharacterized protein DBV15_05894 [Temnothorax longispinosus]